jgi:hypothetical protein
MIKKSYIKKLQKTTLGINSLIINKCLGCLKKLSAQMRRCHALAQRQIEQKQ